MLAAALERQRPARRGERHRGEPPVQERSRARPPLLEPTLPALSGVVPVPVVALVLAAFCVAEPLSAAVAAHGITPGVDLAGGGRFRLAALALCRRELQASSPPAGYPPAIRPGPGAVPLLYHGRQRDAEITDRLPPAGDPCRLVADAGIEG